MNLRSVAIAIESIVVHHCTMQLPKSEIVFHCRTTQIPQSKLELNIIVHANVLIAYPISSFFTIIKISSHREGLKGSATMHTCQVAILLRKEDGGNDGAHLSAQQA